jgi:hypothetical protein
MRPIDKFILHVVHNLSPLFEYEQKQMDILIDYYKQEADDLNIQITDNQLKKYIERFDQLKAGIISKGGTDLLKKVVKQVPVTTPDGETVTRTKNDYEVIVPLSQLIRTVTATAGVDEPKEEYDITPDVVYNKNGLIIYNGSKEENCINFGRGESWCITKTSFGNYRYDSSRKNPTFYLVRDTNLSDTDRKSFFVIVVGSDNTYKASDRSNNDVGGRATEWDRWEGWSFIESNFPSVRGLKNIFKYIPLSNTEKINQSYKNKSITIREWTALPFAVKEQYLIVRKGKDLFQDITNDEFIEKYLPKYTQIANTIATNAGIIDSLILVRNLEKFSNQNVKSIIANMRDKIGLNYLSTDAISFEVKKFLVKFDKWDISKNDRLYVTQDGSTIVKLQLGDSIKVGLYQAEDDFPNVKLNKRTSKYLLDYPELDKIPLKDLINLSDQDIIDKEVVTKVINGAKNNPESALIVKDTDEGTIILDSNSFASYKLNKDGAIVPLKFDDESVQKVFNDSKDNESFQKNALSMFTNAEKIPEAIDRNALVGVIRAIPFNQRTLTIPSNRRFNAPEEPVVLLTTDSEEVPFFFMYTNTSDRGGDMTTAPVIYGSSRGGGVGWRSVDSSENMNLPMYQSFFTYLRQTNQSFTDGTLLGTLGSDRGYRVLDAKKAFAQANPPVSADNVLKIAMNGDEILLINTADTRASRKVSDNSGKLIKANVPPSLAARLLGNEAPPAIAQAATAAGGRGRPAGQPNAPRPAAAPAAAGDINVRQEMDAIGLETAFLRLPRIILRKLNRTNGVRVDPNGDRGAARRNNQLGDRGTVGRVISVGSSKIYIIRLANGQVIASINVQPGNSNYLLFPNESGNVAVALNSPSDLVNALLQRGLAEHHNYLVREFMDNYPEHNNEVKNILKQHLNK